MHIVGVGELTRYLKDLLLEDPYFDDVWVRGEITGYSLAASGHRYFSLKDETAQVRCVLFRNASAYVPPLHNGMSIVAHGRLTIYEPRGEYQLVVDAVEDAGIGLLHLRFEELKAQLGAEGLFDQERKRPIPACPAVVGVVTSPAAAALRDILRVLRLRCPLVEVILAPALVQGDGAADQIAAAIDALNAHGAAEVIVVARGGGSLEDLWAFNEEAVARAIFRSRLPVITGVGHETDFTIADFVADHRASTPTAAAAACVPDLAEWQRHLDETHARLVLLAEQHVELARDRLATVRRDLTRASPGARIEAGRQRVDDAERVLVAQMEHRLQLNRERLRGTALHLHSLSPLLTIGRGYAVVRREPGGEVVTSVRQAPPGQGLSVRVSDGTFAAVAGPRLDAAVPDVAARADAASAGGEPGARRRRVRARTPVRPDTLGNDALGDNEGSLGDG
jgi:exodeoxyribonuclease VII large subunit